MFTRIKAAAVLLAALFGLVAFAAPASAAPARGTAQFKVVRTDGGQRLAGPAAGLQEYCGTYAPAYRIYYVPTGEALFDQSTDTFPCVDGTNVTRLTAPTRVSIYQYASGLNFVTGVFDNAVSLPTRLYNAQGVNTFTYCPPGGACATAVFVVQAYVQGDGAVASVGYFA